MRKIAVAVIELATERVLRSAALVEKRVSESTAVTKAYICGGNIVLRNSHVCTKVATAGCACLRMSMAT